MRRGRGTVALLTGLLVAGAGVLSSEATAEPGDLRAQLDAAITGKVEEMGIPVRSSGSRYRAASTT